MRVEMTSRNDLQVRLAAGIGLEVALFGGVQGELTLVILEDGSATVLWSRGGRQVLALALKGRFQLQKELPLAIY
jgi:hypothetical protein